MSAIITIIVILIIIAVVCMTNRRRESCYDDDRIGGTVCIYILIYYYNSAGRLCPNFDGCRHRRDEAVKRFPSIFHPRPSRAARNSIAVRSRFSRFRVHLGDGRTRRHCVRNFINLPRKHRASAGVGPRPQATDSRKKPF